MQTARCLLRADAEESALSQPSADCLSVDAMTSGDGSDGVHLGAQE